MSSVLCDSATKCTNTNTNSNHTAYMVSEVGLQKLSEWVQNSTPQPPIFQIQIQIQIQISVKTVGDNRGNWWTEHG